MKQGWARRPGSEEGIYGPQYITNEHQELIEECFERGKKNSSEKMSSSQMLKVIQDRFPGVYRYPGQSEVAKAVASLRQKKKLGKEATERKRQVPVETETRLKAIMDDHPGMTGVPLNSVLASSYKDNDRQLPKHYTTKDIQARSNAIHQQRKKAVESNKKKKDNWVAI
jgi:hypothetical protein